MQVKLVVSQGNEILEEVEKSLQDYYDEGYQIVHIVETALGETIETIYTTFVLEKA